MPYNFAAESCHAKKLCSRLSSSKVHFYTENKKIVAFEAPFGGLGATYGVHLRLIGKLVLSSISHNWTSFASCYGCRATSEYRLEIAVFEAGWVSLTQNFR